MWTKPNRMWKARRKYRLLYQILVTQLRGVVPAVHNALEMFVWAMRRLEGQIHSYDMAMHLGILPGSRAVRKAHLDRIHRDLILAMILFEGCFPVGHLNPGFGHFKHYAEYTKLLGPLMKLWMMAFERYDWFVLIYLFSTLLTNNIITHMLTRMNKYIKSLVHHPQHPEKNLSFAASRDCAAQYANLTNDPDALTVVLDRPHHSCVLSGRGTHYAPTAKEFWDLRMTHNATVDCLSITEFKIAYIMGVHFRSGEWGKKPRCGSVITCVLRGRGRFRGHSLYARVNRFFAVDGDDCPGYASVTWFGRPTYLFGGKTPLGVRV